jgi:hypothetical protein
VIARVAGVRRHVNVARDGPSGQRRPSIEQDRTGSCLAAAEGVIEIKVPHKLCYGNRRIASVSGVGVGLTRGMRTNVDLERRQSCVLE